jgi:hypothetical protein
MSNPLQELSEILRDANVRVSFSKNCCSGIVAMLADGSECECWRCRKERGQPHDEHTEAIAASLSKRSQEAMRESVRRAFTA